MPLKHNLNADAFPHWSRRALLQASGLSLLGMAAHSRAATAAATTPAPSQLTVAVIGDGRSGVWASLQSGTGGRKLDTELQTKVIWQPGFTASLPVLEALRAGSVDFTFATATAVVNAVGAGVPIVPLAAYPLPANEVDLIVHADSSIKTAADLKGKKIAHQNGTTGTYSLIKYLESGGLRLGDVQAVSLSGADAYTAFVQGSIDAWIHWQPASALALAKLGNKARVLPSVKTYDYAFYVARASVADKHPHTVARLVRVIRDTQRYVAAHPAETVASWAAQGGFALNSVEQKVNQQLIVDARLSDSGAVVVKAIDAAAADSTQDLANSFHALGVLPKRVDVQSFLLSPKFDAIRKIVATELEA